MDKFLDKFAEFPTKYKYAILAVIVAVSVGVFYQFVYTDKKLQIDKLESELQDLQVELEKAEAYAARYDEFKEELRQVDLQLKEALKKLPEEREIPNLLDQINESVLDAGLSITSFVPQAQTAKEFYSEVPVQLTMGGGYHHLATFADVIGKMERIVTLRDIKISPVGVTGQLNISCSAVTFRQAQTEAE